MASVLAWVDSSSAHRDQMDRLLDAFRDKGTVDELGIGTLRDTFSDYLFPGTSTLHTRARYLLFVAWALVQELGLTATAVRRSNGSSTRSTPRPWSGPSRPERAWRGSGARCSGCGTVSGR